MRRIDLESIFNNTRGMPDCWHIDAAGKSSPEVFQKHFGLPRSLRNEKKILEVADVRSKRLAHFMWCLLHYRNLGLAIMLTGDKSTSPEAHAMARYDEGWHLRNEEDLIELVKLDEDDLNTKLTDLLAQRQDKNYKLQQVKVQALANRANTTVDRAYETMCKCAIETWPRPNCRIRSTRGWSSTSSAPTAGMPCGWRCAAASNARSLVTRSPPSRRESRAIVPPCVSSSILFRHTPSRAVFWTTSWWRPLSSSATSHCKRCRWTSSAKA